MGRAIYEKLKKIYIFFNFKNMRVQGTYMIEHVRCIGHRAGGNSIVNSSVSVVGKVVCFSMFLVNSIARADFRHKMSL